MKQADEAQIDPIKQVTEALMAHPRFDLAVLYYFENFMKWRREIGLVDRFITGHSRQVILYYVCILHFKNQTDLPEMGATFGRLWEVVENRKECGSRALRTMLGIATRAGYLKKQKGREDMRAIAYVPTQSMLNHIQANLAHTLKCLDIILGTDTYAKEAASDPDFLAKNFHLIGNSVYKHKIAMVDIDPFLGKLARTSGGLATANAIAVAQMKDQPLVHPKVIAKTGNFSVSQIRTNLNYLVKEGALKIDTATNKIISATTTDLVKMLLARELALHVKYRLGLEEHVLKGTSP